MKKYATLILSLLMICAKLSIGQSTIITGAERMDVYAPLLKGKTVAVFANQTSMVGNIYLVDALIKKRD
jgi:uncharacterized protein YbbC (DUF1343 family)